MHHTSWTSYWRKPATPFYRSTLGPQFKRQTLNGKKKCSEHKSSREDTSKCQPQHQTPWHQHASRTSSIFYTRRAQQVSSGLQCRLRLISIYQTHLSFGIIGRFLPLLLSHSRSWSGSPTAWSGSRDRGHWEN